MSSSGEFFDHPSPRFDFFVQIICALMVAAMVVLIIAQIPLVLIAGFPLLLSLLVVITCLGLIPFMLLPTISSPAVTVSREGIELHPRLWRGRFVPWSEISAVKRYPLMPSKGSERTRELLVGRRKYTVMDGVMLLIPTLPFVFRFHGLLVSEGFTGVIALTNRTHANYDRLITLIPGAADIPPLGE